MTLQTPKSGNHKKQFSDDFCRRLPCFANEVMLILLAWSPFLYSFPNSAGDELLHLHDIIGLCDIIVTPIVDPKHTEWKMPPNIEDWFQQYKAEAWQVYLSRPWVRAPRPRCPVR